MLISNKVKLLGVNLDRQTHAAARLLLGRVCAKVFWISGNKLIIGNLFPTLKNFEVLFVKQPFQISVVCDWVFPSNIKNPFVLPTFIAKEYSFLILLTNDTDQILARSMVLYTSLFYVLCTTSHNDLFSGLFVYDLKIKWGWEGGLEILFS